MSRRREWFRKNRDKILSELGKQCQNCNKRNKLNVHHIVPLSLGGSNYLTNFAVLCESCHRKAHGFDTDSQHSEMTKRGLQKARKAGKSLGRPVARNTTERVHELKSKGYSQSKTAMLLCLSVSTVKRHWNRK